MKRLVEVFKNKILSSNLGFAIYIVKYREQLNILKKNSSLLNKYEGKRCFVLGNGPSLRKQDLSLLHEEYVFTVNQFLRYEEADLVNTNFHVWIDNNFFDIDEKNSEDLELLAVMKKVQEENPKTICFYPINQMAFVEKHGLNKNAFFFKQTISAEHFKMNDIDFTKFVPAFGTVVQMAIALAIYMGFKEIYLLGCDNTSLITTIKSVLKSNDDTDYVYKISLNEKKRMETRLSKSSLEDYVRTYLEVFVGYRKLNLLCNYKNIKLINSSAETAIDSIPRKKFEEVLKANQRWS